MERDMLDISDNNVEWARRKGKKLTPKEKWQLFLETAFKGAPIGEILRRRGLHSSDLAKIRREVETGALKELGRGRYSKKSQVTVPYQEYERLQAELAAKEKALSQMSEEYLLLKKRTD